MSAPEPVVGFDFERRPAPDDARVELTVAVRQVIEYLTASNATSDAFVAARDLVARAAALLAADRHDRIYQSAEASLADGFDGGFIDFSPLVGVLNPLAPPIGVRAEDGRIVGEAVFGNAYEGPPGCVHGGFIAAGFDEVLGFAQSMAGMPGMTARLSVSYRSPTPLGQPVRYAGWVDRVEGRKIHTLATLHHGDTLCAEAEAMFVSMRPEVFERLMRERRHQAD